MKQFAAPFALIALLCACGSEEEESVEEKFRRTEALIHNTAESLEAETANAVSATENLLEKQADAFGNSLEAAGAVDTNEVAANQAR